jgi:hypothetical protein
MVDFVGQKRVLLISSATCAITVPVSIIFAFIMDNYLYGLYFDVVVAILLMVVFGPPWPYLKLDKPDWKPDSALPTTQEKIAAEEALTSAQRHRRRPGRR